MGKFEKKEKKIKKYRVGEAVKGGKILRADAVQLVENALKEKGA